MNCIGVTTTKSVIKLNKNKLTYTDNHDKRGSTLHALLGYSQDAVLLVWLLIHWQRTKQIMDVKISILLLKISMFLYYVTVQQPKPQLVTWSRQIFQENNFFTSVFPRNLFASITRHLLHMYMTKTIERNNKKGKVIFVHSSYVSVNLSSMAMA